LLKIAIPNKGRLSEATLDLFRKAGLKVESTPDRKLFATALDRTVQILFLRANDIPEFVQDGVADLGITGKDILQESGKDVREVMDLQYGYCRLVVAVPQASGWKSVEEIPDDARVATSFPNLTRRFFGSAGKKVRVVEVSGATELTPHIGVADLITDLVSSGSTLAMNNLRELATIQPSTARVIANGKAWDAPAIRARMDHLLASLDSVVKARGKRYLMANVPRSKLDDVRRILPGISGPTIMDILSHPEVVAAHAVVDEDHLLDIVARLKDIGATGVLVLPIERLVP
jgi:ATP phosphoribosyltransferase